MGSKEEKGVLKKGKKLGGGWERGDDAGRQKVIARQMKQSKLHDSEGHTKIPLLCLLHSQLYLWGSSFLVRFLSM